MEDVAAWILLIWWLVCTGFVRSIYRKMFNVVYLSFQAYATEWLVTGGIGWVLVLMSFGFISNLFS